MTQAVVERTDELASVVESVVIQGDLARLKPEERVSYYRSVCESLGLNPLTKPFEYLILNSRLTLYARKDATDQLRASRAISVEITGRKFLADAGLYVVTARAVAKDGRTDESRGRRTVRENISQLIDPVTWVEYGQLTIAGQQGRRPLKELIRKTPADGLVAGIGSVNGDLFDEHRARTMFISYDDTVLAGTQGARGHDKADRMMELANELSLPLMFHAEGAGGRSGHTEVLPSIHPAVRTFERMAQWS
ncbi:MAG: hypothetical protein Kow0010_20460 [Dehalococcoidia bacterium]